MTRKTDSVDHILLGYSNDDAAAGAGRGPSPPTPAGTYTTQGTTDHFVVMYDDALAASTGPEFSDAILASCEEDYGSIRGQFAGIEPPNLPLVVKVIPPPGSIFGASHRNCATTEITVYVRQVSQAPIALAAEVVEVFSAAQDQGWDCAASNGEALSRVLSNELHPDAERWFVTADLWLKSERRNVVDWTDPKAGLTPSNKDEATSYWQHIGGSTLFCNYLRYQLGFGWQDIVAAGAPTLAGVYAKLTGDEARNAYRRFSDLVTRLHFPPGLQIELGGYSDNPFPVGGLAAVSSARGIDLFAQDRLSRRMLHWWSDNGGFGGPDGWRGTAIGPPAAVSWGENRLDVFARDLDGQLAHWWYPASNGVGLEQLGMCDLPPAAVSWAPGRLDVFTRDRTKSLDLHHWWSSNSGFDDEPLKGFVITHRPAAVSWGEGRLDVFGRGTGATVLHRSYSADEGWHDQDLGGVVTGALAACSWGPGRLDVVARSLHGEILHWWSNDGREWGSTEAGFGETLPADIPALSDPCIVAWATGRLDVFAQSDARTLYHWWQPTGNGGWAFEDLGGVLESAPVAVSPSDGRLDVFAQGLGATVCHWWYPGPEGFGGPEGLAGTLS